MSEPQDTEDERRTDESNKRDLSVSRRDVMRAAGVTGVLAGYAGLGGAQEGSTCTDAMDDVDPECELKRKYEENSLDTALACNCDPEAEPSGCITYTNGEECVYITTSALEFYDTTHVTLKVGNECDVHSLSESTLETLTLNCENGPTEEVEVRKFCSRVTNKQGQTQDISHVELFNCPQPKVTELDATCDTLTITTEDTDCADITVDYRLQLVEDNEDGTVDVVDDSVVDVDDLTVSDDGCDGTYTIDVSGVTEPWNRVSFDKVELGGTDMLDEGGITDTTRRTSTLCAPPTGAVEADCSTLTIKNLTGLEGGDVSFDYTLQLVDSEGTVTNADVSSATGVTKTVDTDGKVTVDVSGVSDPWNKAVVSNLTFNGNALSLDPSEDMTPALCNPPKVTDLDIDCSGTLTITTENTPEGDTLLVDYKLEKIDADGTFVETTATKTEVSTQVNASGVATIDLTEGGSITGWNVVEVSSVEHDPSDEEMLASSPQRRIVTVV